MYGNYLVMAFTLVASVIMLLLYVKKTQIRVAVLAILLAQTFSWPVTLLYVQFGLQENPVRLFPHATASNFLLAFVMHPAIYAVYYLHYPYQAKKYLRVLYTTGIVTVSILLTLLFSLFTDLVYIPNKLTIFGSFIMLFAIFSVMRVYMDWYTKTYLPRKGDRR